MKISKKELKKIIGKIDCKKILKALGISAIAALRVYDIYNGEPGQHIEIHSSNYNKHGCWHTYSDAIKAVANSTLPSYDKANVLSSIKTDQECSYYESVINIVKSNMVSYDKVNAIRSLW